MSTLGRRAAILVFLAFAFAYFFSALIRAITATLSPTLTQEFSLQSADLGLLAGGYFLGFALMQLPLGRWLDRHGPRHVSLAFLALAVAGCVAFAAATSFTALFIARVLCGMGLAAALMAPLTGYRTWLEPTAQLRANSWMLMTGSMGMVASTLPVQWLLPAFGWRPIFSGMALALLLAMAVIAWLVPPPQHPPKATHTPPADAARGYGQVWRAPLFRRLTPLGFLNYGGMVAIQTLWVVPWLRHVAQHTPDQAASRLFWINVSMLVSFWLWGLVSPQLARRGIHAETVIKWGTPVSLGVLAFILFGDAATGPYAGFLWAAYCVTSTVMSLAQPAVGMAFPATLAGRALSAYNLVIFAGVFAVQWGLGLLIDALQAQGWTRLASYRGAFGVFLLLGLICYVYFIAARRDNEAR